MLTAKDISALLSVDNSLFNSTELNELLFDPGTQAQTRLPKSQKFSSLSLRKCIIIRQSTSKEDKQVLSASNSKRKWDAADLFQDTFDFIDDTKILFSQQKENKDANASNNRSKSDGALLDYQQTTTEFDAFQQYFKTQDNKPKISDVDESDGFFINSQVINQIDSVIKEREMLAKVVDNTNSAKDSKLKRQLTDKLEDLFSESNRIELEEFFDRLEMSISKINSDEEKDEKISQIIELICSQVNQNVIKQGENSSPNAKTHNEADNIDWGDESLLNVSRLTGINCSFATSLQKILVSNAKREVSFSEQINASIAPQLNNFQTLGPFYGLPRKVEDLILKYKGISKLYDWQDECLKKAIENRSNLIYALPTSGGKTLVAEILMMREVLCNKRNTIFVLPFVAIVQEKVWALSSFGVELDFLIEEYAANKGTYPPRKRRRKNSIYIATIEKALGLINSLIETERIQEIGQIVIDELHLIGEQDRGCTLEALLTKIMLTKAEIQVIGMSATIGNLNDICKFLNAEVYTGNFRPVELTEFVKCGQDIAKVCSSPKSEELLEVVRNTSFGYTKSQVSIDPDHVGGLVMEVIPENSCLIFCPTKKNCENVAQLLTKVLEKGLTNHKKEQKLELRTHLKQETGQICKILNTSLKFGVAYHHSGLTHDERTLIENAFREGVISVICCTSTLAAGVNLPAQRVIIRQPYVSLNFITLSRYKQMIGRAGRAGLGEVGESILICQKKDMVKVRQLLTAPMDKARSHLHENDGVGLRQLLLSCISLGLANTRRELQQVAKKTLLAIQSEALEVNVKRLTDRAISELFKMGALEEGDLSKPEVNLNDEDISVRFDSTLNNTSVLSDVIDETQVEQPPKKIKKKLLIRNDTKLVISKLGCAAIKGGFELNRAHLLYDDLYQAQQSLVLVDSLHLLYLITPYDMAMQVRPNKNDYYNIYCSLDANEMKTARVLGITESVALKMLSNKQIKEVPERVLNRFFLTLVLYDLWKGKAVFQVAEKFQLNRGMIETLMTSAATFAFNVVNFCDGLEEFWTFAQLLNGIGQRVSHCCMKELLPLMDLPSVKQRRAKQLYNAGFKTLQSIAKAKESDLVANIEYLSRKVARQLISAAKMLLLEKIENLREEAKEVYDGLENTI